MAFLGGEVVRCGWRVGGEVERCEKRSVVYAAGRRWKRSVVRASASGGGGVSSGGEDGRRSEFRISDGNQTLQNRLAEQLAWEVQAAGKSDQLDFFIQSELYKFRQDLGSQYTRGQRGFTSRSNRLAMLESLGHVSKWNQEFIHIDRETRETQRQIREELAVIDALLRRTEMHKARASKRARGSSSSASSKARRAALLSQPKLKTLSTHETVVCVGVALAITSLGFESFHNLVHVLGAEKFNKVASFVTAGTASVGYFALLLNDLTVISSVQTTTATKSEDASQPSAPRP